MPNFVGAAVLSSAFDDTDVPEAHACGCGAARKASKPIRDWLPANDTLVYVQHLVTVALLSVALAWFVWKLGTSPSTAVGAAITKAGMAG